MPLLCISALRRFEYKVYARGDCWEWRGQRHPNGYGQLKQEQVKMWAHRVAYTLAKGPIPVGMEIDHLCRHPWCVRPSHLEVVTHAINRARARKSFCPYGHRRTLAPNCQPCDTERHRIRRLRRAGDSLDG